METVITNNLARRFFYPIRYLFILKILPTYHKHTTSVVKMGNVINFIYTLFFLFMININ